MKSIEAIEPNARTVGELYNFTKKTLAESGVSASPAQEARWIFEQVLDIHSPVLFAHPEKQLTPNENRLVGALLDRYLSGVPLPYCFGEWYFYGRPFIVSPAVLIPRPESELLVDEAVTWLERHPDIRSFADIGTGSGCLACSIALNAPNDLHATLVDVSPDALKIASENVARYQLQQRLTCQLGDLTRSLSAPQHLIIANLPYIPSERCETLDVARSEPLLALNGGPDGFDLIRAMLTDLTAKMVPPYLILCEIDDSHENLTADYAAERYPAAKISVRRDFAEKPRILRIEDDSPASERHL